MNINDLIQQSIAAGAPIDTAWNMFIFVHFALIGGLYTINHDIGWKEKGFVIVLYTFFAYLNWGSLVFSYLLYDSILLDIKAVTSDNVGLYKTAVKFLSGKEYGSRQVLVTAIHAIAWVLVVAFVSAADRILDRSRRMTEVKIKEKRQHSSRDQVST